MAPRLALFDLDGTLLAEDTQLLFCNYVLERHATRRLFLPFVLPFVPAVAVRVLGAEEMKRVFLSYLWLMPRARLIKYASDFARCEVVPRVYPELLDEIRRHRQDGRVLVMNSASPDFYVKEIGTALGFDHAFGTRVIVHDLQPLIAEIDGRNNKQEAKLPPMEAAGLLPCDEEDSWAYSDSAADLPMLELVKNPVLVNPSRSFAAHGEACHWRILRPPRPWRSRAGQLGAIVRQVLGMYR